MLNHILAALTWIGIAFLGKWIGHWYGKTIFVIFFVFGVLGLIAIIGRIIGGFLIYKSIKRDQENSAAGGANGKD